MIKWKGVILLLRPQQWVKNSFIFLPLFFGKKIGNFPELTETLYAFIAFSLITSSIYCLNDLLDIKNDKLHPIKSKRPLASGLINKITAITILLILLILAILIFKIAHTNIQVIYFCTFYFFMNVAYCFYLKQFAILDIIIISVGFVIRLFIGGASSNTYLSHWIVIMTFLLALFLAIAKRKDDYTIYLKSGDKARKNVSRYNLEFINTVLSIVVTIILVSYIMYTVSPEVVKRIGSDYLYVTTIFVLLGLLRYLQLTIVDNKSGSPTKIIFNDRFIQLSLIGWILIFSYFLYF